MRWIAAAAVVADGDVAVCGDNYADNDDNSNATWKRQWSSTHDTNCQQYNGLLRKYDVKNIKAVFKTFNLKLNIINAEHLFLKKLKNVTEPELKRKIIGGLFVEVFSNYIRKLSKKDFYLAQGTLYTDIIESRSFHGGKSVTIKSHHHLCL